MALKLTRICDMCNTEYELGIVKCIKTIDNLPYPVDFICSDCILKINRLAEMAFKENNGKGINCVSSIIGYLNRCEVSTAKTIYVGEEDKISSYPKIQDWFYKNFGCEIHLKIDCKNELCLESKKCNDEKLKE